MLDKSLFIGIVIGAVLSTAPIRFLPELHAQDRQVWRLVQENQGADPFFWGGDCADSLHCAISATGIFGGDSYITGTSDGGKSWQKIFIDTGMDGRSFPLLVGGVAYPSPRLLIVTADSGFIHRSTDAGRSWETRRIIVIPNGKAVTAGQIAMLDTLHGILAWKVPRFDDNGVPEFVMTTSDGGRTWDTMQTSPILPEWATQQPAIDGLACVAPDRFVCIVTNYGGIFKIASTADGGKTWNYADNPLADSSSIQFTRLEFPDPRNGFLTGIDTRNGRASFVASTHDSGRTWELLHHGKIDGAQGGMYYSSFRDSLNGLGAGGGTVFRTSDGGRTWERDSLESLRHSTPDRLWVHWLTDHRGVAANGSFFIWDALSSAVTPQAMPDPEIHLNAFPNPLLSGGELTVRISVPVAGNLRLRLYSPLGLSIIELDNRVPDSGIYETRLDAGGLPSGSYLLRVDINGIERTYPVILIR